MKRGFLSSPSVPKDTKPSPQPVNAKRKKSDEAEARTQPDIQNAPKESYPTQENVAQILEAEVLREKLAHEMVEVKLLDCLYVRFTLVQLENLKIRREEYKTAIGGVEKDKASKDVWLCGGGGFFLKMPKGKALKVMEQGMLLCSLLGLIRTIR